MKRIFPFEYPFMRKTVMRLTAQFSYMHSFRLGFWNLMQ